MLESWVLRLATALKASLTDANVVITDWLPLAHQHYPTAAQSTRTVGKDIAHLLQSLQVRADSEQAQRSVALLDEKSYNTYCRTLDFLCDVPRINPSRYTTGTPLKRPI